MSDGDEQETEERTEDRSGDQDGRSDADKAAESKEAHDKAQETMKELEEQDEPPSDPSEWPDDEAKYVTYGGPEGDHSYDEGPEKKLGPSSLERHEDGSISIEGEEVDDPEEHKGEPIPGGPTDPNAPDLAGEDKDKKGEKKGDDDSEEKGASDDGDSAES